MIYVLHCNFLVQDRNYPSCKRAQNDRNVSVRLGTQSLYKKAPRFSSRGAKRRGKAVYVLGIWWRCALRRYPKLDEQFAPCRTDEGHDAMLIQTTRVHEILDDAARVLLNFAFLA